MPTETFLRLPAEKQERIVQAAMEEFARASFAHASINQIVKASAISRGSFYQYFTDKEDIYQYILSLIRAEKLDVYNKDAPQGQTGGIFAPLMAALPAIFQWAEQNPLYYRIGRHLAVETPEFFSRMFSNNDIGYRWFRDYLEEAQRAGRIRPDANLDLVVNLLIVYAATLLEQYYRQESEAACIRNLKEFFDLMERGICQDGGVAHG